MAKTNNIKSIITKMCVITLMAAFLFASVLNCETVNAEEEARQTFILCIDNSFSMKKYKDDIINLVETFDYIVNCSYNKPAVHTMNFNTDFHFQDNSKDYDIVDWAYNLEYGLKTNIVESLEGVNEYLIKYYGLEEVESEEEIEAYVLEELQNTHFIYISDCEDTFSETDEVVFNSYNCLQYIHSYINMFDSRENADKTANFMKNVVFSVTDATSEKADNYDLYYFIKYVVEILGGEQTEYEYNRPNAKEGKYSQLFYILQKDGQEDDEETANKFDNSIVEVEENSFIKPYILYHSNKMGYNSLLCSIHETTEEEIVYNAAENRYDVFSFVLKKPGVVITCEGKTARRENIDFSMYYDKDIYNESEIYNYRLEYILYNNQNKIIERKDLPVDVLVYSSSYEVPSTYFCQLILTYETSSFDGDVVINRTAASDLWEFKVENSTPLPHEKISRYYIISEEALVIDLNELVSDAENDDITFTVTDGEEHCSKEGSTLYFMQTEVGEHDIDVQAVDVYGKSSTIRIQVDVEDIGKDNNIYLIIVIFILLLIFAGGGAMFIKRRNK